MQRMRREKIRDKALFLAGLFLIAVLFFSQIYGLSILNPENTGYVYNNYDTEQHYFGWSEYRDAAWSFPLGLHDRLIYPDDTSVIFTDSIPMLAFTFKLLSPMLPETFQYFGLWALLCMLLTAVLTSMILSLFSDRTVLIFLSSILMMLIPTQIMRAFAHEALGGQWLVLFAIYIWMRAYVSGDFPGKKQLIVYPALLGFLAGGIHIYFLPICGMVMAGFCLYLILKKAGLRSVIPVAAYIAGGALSVYLWGGFSVELSMGDADYSIGNTANLNSLINPLSNSGFFGGLPLLYQGQDDGYGYLGLGMWIAVIVGIVILWRHCGRDRAMLISLAATVLFAAWFMTYPVISIGDRLIFEYRMPALIDSIMAIFRCNGRGVWVITYILMTIGLIGICRGDGKKLMTLFLMCAIVLQMVDLVPLMREKYQYCNYPRVITNALDDSKEVEELLATGKYKHVFMDESLLWSEEAMLFATEHHLTTNRYYLARQNEAENARRMRAGKESLSDDTIYVFSVDAAHEMEELGLTIIYMGEYNYVGILE